MLQDLAFGHLDNHYEDHAPKKGDIVLCMQGNGIMVARDRLDALTLPLYEQVQDWCADWQHWDDQPFRYVFTLQEVRYFLWMGQAGQPGDAAFAYEPAATLRQVVSKTVCFAAMTGWHLFCWYRDARFCGRCGTATVHDSKERMMRCPECNNMIFPKIAPSVIVGVIIGKKHHIKT